jgi:hypothetical protein
LETLLLLDAALVVWPESAPCTLSYPRVCHGIAERMLTMKLDGFAYFTAVFNQIDAFDVD